MPGADSAWRASASGSGAKNSECGSPAVPPSAPGRFGGVLACFRLRQKALGEYAVGSAGMADVVHQQDRPGGPIRLLGLNQEVLCRGGTVGVDLDHQVSFDVGECGNTPQQGSGLADARRAVHAQQTRRAGRCVPQPRAGASHSLLDTVIAVVPRLPRCSCSAPG